MSAAAYLCPRCKDWTDSPAHTTRCDMARLDRWTLDMGDHNTARVHELEVQLANVLEELAQCRRASAGLRMERDALRAQGSDLRARLNAAYRGQAPSYHADPM